MHRLLVIRIDLIGDVVLTLPAVRALRRQYPYAEIDMLVLASSAGILASEPDIDHVIAIDPYFWRKPSAFLHPSAWTAAYQTLRSIRASHYDIALSMCGDLASILARLSGAPHRLGYAEEAYAHMLNEPVTGGRYRTRKHEIDYCLELASAAGAKVTSADRKLRLAVDTESRRLMLDRVQELRHRAGKAGPLVIMHAGARNGQAKRWPAEHLARLAQLLNAQLEGLVVLTGAGSERTIADAVVQIAGSAVQNIAGETNLSELVALLSLADVCVTGDSGPMHIAAAVGTRVVALHGPTDPALSGPISDSSIVLRHPLWCAPCYDPAATAECRFGNPVCMKLITPESVLEAVVTQISQMRITPTPVEATEQLSVLELS